MSDKSEDEFYECRHCGARVERQLATWWTYGIKSFMCANGQNVHGVSEFKPLSKPFWNDSYSEYWGSPVWSAVDQLLFRTECRKTGAE